MQNIPVAPLYDTTLVQPMRDEVTNVGVTELRTAAEVDQILGKGETTLIFINSVCGCSAGGARPALRMAMSHETRPKNVVSVFAGQDREATEQARSYLHGFPPSSPMFVILDGKDVVHAIPRHHIEGRTPEQIAANLVSAFNEFCGVKGE